VKDIKTSQGKLSLILNILFIIVIIVLVIVIINISKKKGNSEDIITHDKSGNFLLTNPILDCEDNGLDNNLVVFSGDFNKKVEKLKEKYLLTYIFAT
jgi:hypothetical protein